MVDVLVMCCALSCLLMYTKSYWQSHLSSCDLLLIWLRGELPLQEHTKPSSDWESVHKINSLPEAHAEVSPADTGCQSTTDGQCPPAQDPGTAECTSSAAPAWQRKVKSSRP